MHKRQADITLLFEYKYCSLRSSDGGNGNNSVSLPLILLKIKVSEGAKIRNRYNQVPHLTQDTDGKVAI